QVFLAGLKAALEADSTFAGGRYIVPPARGLRAFARVYAGWAYSQAFFRRGAWRELGHASCAALLADWEREHLAWDANDLLAMLWSWQHADIARAGGFATLAAALAAIPARVIAMPCATDLYFPPADNALEVAALPAGELRVIDSDWGHVAGGPDREPRATARIEQAIRDLLD
ncbi:MAG: homoserine acetyltransferase, partial [Gammaproteobacteria bacterium]